MITIDYDPKHSRCSIKGDYFDQLREHFSAANENAQYIKRFNPYVKTRMYAITPTGQFNIGLYTQIRAYLLEQQQFDIVLTDAFKHALQLEIPFDVTESLNPKYSLRDYQSTALAEILKHGRGICLMGTGAGKTLTIALLIENIYKMFGKNMSGIIVVPDLGLVTQTFNDFNDYQVTFTYSKWTGSHSLEQGSNVTIVNSANLLSKFTSNEWIKHVDFVIGDEVHKLGKGKEIDKVLSKVKTLHKFGFTGTLPTKKEDEWNVVGKFGPVVYEKSSHELRSEGFLTNVIVKALKLKYNESPKYITGGESTDNFHIELDFISTNQYRNKVIHKLVDNFTENVLILVNQIKHGELLYNLLNQLPNKTVYFIRGEVEVEDREKIKIIMENNRNVVCIAISAIFSTGVNVKNIFMIMFAAGGKSFIRTIQSIGRGLRLHPDKKELIIIDLVDEVKYGKKHFAERAKFYVKENIKCNVIELQEKP